MKPTKVIGSKPMINKSLLRCVNSCKQLDLRTIKSKNDKLQLLKTKKSAKLKRNVRTYDGGEYQNSCNYVKYGDLPKKIKVTKIVNHKNETNEKRQCPNNTKIEKQIRRMSSKIFSRKFSKYEDVQKKLKAKFKSSYKSSGKFDQSSTKYKAYVNKNKNKKNKSFLKYSMCSFGFNKEILKKKSTVVCPELPGKGTYNHRFAYDEALKLQRKGIEVDVLYKVKNKTDSIYVINGEFLWTKNKPLCTSLKQSKKRKVISDTDKITEEQTLDNLQWISMKEKDELAKIQKAKEREKRLAKMVLIQRAEEERKKKLKQEDFMRKRDLAEIEKALRGRQIKKMLREKSLKEKKAKEEEINQNQMEIDRANVEMEKLRLLKLQQIKESIKYNNNDNTNITHTADITDTTDNKEEINTENAYGGLEAIIDSNIINDIGLWALRNDCTVDNMSWLKIVAGRIDSLDGRVDESCKNKWMQIAIDKVVDDMTRKKLLSDFSKNDLSHRQLLCNKSVQVSSRFVIKNKRIQTKCHKQTSINIRKSPKFSGCPDGQVIRKLYKVIKTEGSCFQLISADAFGS